jgi:hypothetical protein
VLGLAVSPDPVIAGHKPCGAVAVIGSSVSQELAHIGKRVLLSGQPAKKKVLGWIAHGYRGLLDCFNVRL